MSSHLRYPHLRKQARPHCSDTPEPLHKNKKEGVSAMASMRRSMISFGVHTSISSSSINPPAASFRRRYSSQGGSMRMTSNFVPRVVRSKSRKSTFLYVDGVARSEMRRSLRSTSSLSFGYSVKRSSTSLSLMKFAGRKPVSTKCWEKSFFARSKRPVRPPPHRPLPRPLPPPPREPPPLPYGVGRMSARGAVIGPGPPIAPGGIGRGC
mmetsp:Transcript_29308/g.48616  ORF Transcript_29308/g.48616 Transcript_29308/m.48616 type:complete len:209 (+) Transcript_29308:139-765(+)